MRVLLITISVFLIISDVFGQFIPNRYQADVFSQWTETSEVQFSTAVPQPTPGGGFYEWITGYPLNADEVNTINVDLYMDIFEPVGDTQSKRPVIIICFGGGFLDGSKDHWSMRLLAQDLAKRGFVTATIDYRLGMNIFDEGLSQRAVYRGLQDGRSAIRFFRADAAGANHYNIDPDEIYIGGHSAGAFIGTHIAYIDKAIERPLSTTSAYSQGGTALVDQGCFDCAGDNQGFSGHANSIFSLAGAVGDLNYMETADDPSIVMFHSSDDGTVPYTNGEPFSNVSLLVVGSDLPVVYGSQNMDTRAANIGLPKEFYSYSNRGHGVHEDGNSALYNDIVPGISDWFYNEELKPEDHQIYGPDIVCSTNLTRDYSTDAGLAEQYDWQVTGGSFVLQSSSSNEVTVLWDANAPVKSLSVTPYSCGGAAGDQIDMVVSIQTTLQNNWITNAGNWDDPSNWSLGVLPQVCHDTHLPAQGSNYFVDLNGINADIRSLTLDPNTTLNISSGSTLDVKGGGVVDIMGILNHSGSIVVRDNMSPDSELRISGQLTNAGTGIIELNQSSSKGLELTNTGSLINNGHIEVK